MSHFAVLVIGLDVEDQLAPFQENNMGDCPKEFLEFSDHEDEYRKEFESDSVDMVELPSGKRVYTWDDSVKNIPSHNYKRVTVAHKERFQSVEEFAKEWHGVERDELTGKFGHWENPNKKWDWYEVGGRWRNWFLLKDGTRSNRATKREVDWDGMMRERSERAKAEYDWVFSKIGHFPPNVPFHYDETLGDHPSQCAKYWTQPRCAEWKRLRDLDFQNRHSNRKANDGSQFVDFIMGSPDNYLCTRDEFIQRERRAAVTLFAFLKDKKWAEKGRMGWWGCVSNENDAWPDVFWKLLQGLDDSEILTVVDCHI